MVMVVPGSVEALEEALVRCHDLWRRTPGDGGSPWANDGPWYLAQGEVGDVKGDWSTTLITNDAGRELEVRKVESRRPRGALDCADVAERDRVTAWLGSIGDLTLRRAVWWAMGDLASDQGRPRWSRIARSLGYAKSAEALARACRGELALLVCRLNGWPANRARALLGKRHGLAAVRAERAPFVVLEPRP